MLFYPLYYDIISLTSLKITQAFHLLLGFAENQTVFSDFKIRNSVRVTEGSDNGDLDNRGPTVFSILYKECQSIIHSYYTEYFAFAYIVGGLLKRISNHKN